MNHRAANWYGWIPMAVAVRFLMAAGCSRARHGWRIAAAEAPKQQKKPDILVIFGDDIGMAPTRTA